MNKVQSASYSTFPTPSITISVESPRNRHEALLDSRADANIMPLSVYHKLCNKAKSESTAHLYNFQKQQVSTQGEAKIQIFYEGVSLTAKFQLVDCHSDPTIILGKPWIVKHACTLNFALSRMQFTIDGHQFSTPMKKPHTIRLPSTVTVAPPQQPRRNPQLPNLFPNGKRKFILSIHKLNRISPIDLGEFQPLKDGSQRNFSKHNVSLRAQNRFGYQNVHNRIQK